MVVVCRLSFLFVRSLPLGVDDDGGRRRHDHDHRSAPPPPTHTQVPIYENMVLGVRVQTTPLGGRDLTAYLASMLDSCTTDPYSAQPLRRRLGIARLVKERHAYVAGDFVAEVRYVVSVLGS